MKLRTLLASTAAILTTAVIATAGVNVKHTDTGGLCWEFTSAGVNTDAWCWSALGVFDLDPATTAADSAATNDMFELKLDTPVDTTGTNTHNALTIDIDEGNATGGTNSIRGIQIDALTGDASNTTVGINVGAMTGTGGTENAIVIGSGWDAGISTASPMSLSSTFSTTGDLSILTPGDLIVGAGTPSVTQNGEDAYVTGTFEVDGASEFDGAIDIDSTITVGTTAINTATLTSMARGYFEVCGDITTVNANTVYYGPSQAVIDSATAGRVTCNTDATGNTTEATADEPAVQTTAIYPLGMVCYTTDMGATGSPLTFALRSAAAAITPAISLTIADDVLSGTANATATTAIGSGATVAVALTSAGDVGAGAFYCRVNYAY